MDATQKPGLTLDLHLILSAEEIEELNKPGAIVLHEFVSGGGFLRIQSES